MRLLAYRRVLKIMALLILVAPFLVSRETHALELVNRRVLLTDSRPDTLVSHEASFDFASATNVGSISFEYCSNSPLVVIACVPSTGINMDVDIPVLSSESGETGFSVDVVNTTANRLVITRTSAAVTPGAASYLYSDVRNPDVTGTHYVRMSTYITEDGTGAATDQGSVAISINDPVDVGAFVPPILLFCLGTSIPTNSCSSAVGNFIDFGELTEEATALATTQMIAATNGVGGYNIYVTGTTMTSGNNVIQQLSSQDNSDTNESQFGINLVNNSSPTLGANTTGPGDGAATNFYNDTNLFRFNNGDIIASSSNSTDYNKFTTSYIVNIDDDQEPGVYSTTLTYIALASF